MVVFFVYFGSLLGRAVLPNETLLHRSWAGGLLLLSLIMLAGTAFYYFGYISSNLFVVFVLLTPPLVYFTSRHRVHEHDTLHSLKHKIPTPIIAAVIIILLLLIVSFTLIGKVEILDAVRSVWERVPSEIFLCVFGINLSLAGLALRAKERALLLPLFMVILFLFVSIAILTYPLGFGFDNFIHLATESHIAEYGTITPKPLYYIGQYAGVLFLSQAFVLPLELVDRIFLPILSSLIIPLAWYFSFVHLAENRRAATFSLLGLFLIPLAGFIVTTPQGLANLWTLTIILLSLPLLKNEKGVSLTALFVLGFTTLAIHPLAGIPIMLYLALIASGPFAKFCPTPKLSQTVFWAIAISGSVMIPIVFLVNAKISNLALSFDWSSLSPTGILRSINPEVFFENRFSSILDFVYLYGFNTILFFVALSLIGYLVFRRQLSRNFSLPVIMVIMLLINFLVLRSAVEFTFLIDYERSNYADRLVTLAVFFLTPFLGLFFLKLWQRVVEQPIVIRAFVITLIAALMTSTLYITYPRKDNYVTSHGFNVSQSDINAVYSIDELGGDSDYIVLANQSVSAAAIREFDFKKYYDNIFYYPIPTGGTLYEYFLQMNDGPDRKTAEAAMDLTGVDRLFYVVNEYWWQAPRIIETAKRSADSWMAIDNGQIYVFEYLRE